MNHSHAASTALLAILFLACSDQRAADQSNGNLQTDAGLGFWGDAGSTGSADSGAGGHNISLGGAQDFGYFRKLLNDNVVPRVEDFDAAGFFAEHYLTLPGPNCGQRVCIQSLLGILGNLMTGAPMAMLQLGLNTPIEIDTETRPALNLAVVVDTSGSMDQDGKIDFVRTGLTTLINNLEDGDHMALIGYSTTARLLVAMEPISVNRQQLLDRAEALAATGGTNFYAGLDRGYREVLQHYDGARQNRVIILSDGQPTEGITDESAIVQMSAQYNADGIGLTTVGLGTEFNASLMRSLSEQGHGNHYFLENSEAIEEVFTEEISYFTVPVAFDVVVEVTEGSPYQFVRAFGSSFWEDSSDGGRVEVPSVFLSHRVSSNPGDPGNQTGRRGGGSALLVQLVPTTPPLDPSATSSNVANLSVSFRAPGETVRTSQQIEVTYPFAATYIPPRGYFSAADPTIVHKSFVMLNAYIAIERACGAFHENQGSEAIAGLRRMVAAVEDYNEELFDGTGDLDMTSDVELIHHLIEVMIANGASEPNEVDIPGDPWPVDAP